LNLLANISTLGLKPDFFDAVRVDLELLMAKLIVSQVFISRNNRIEVKYAFIGSFQVAK